jgi:hypothetical protein
MAKDLPYFKFIISEWNDGDVTICSFEAQGLFINLCSIYWSQEGNLSFVRAKRRFSGCNATAWEELVNEGIIKLDGDDVVINFLDEQLEERGKLSKTNSENAAKGWEKRRNNATALPSHSDPIEVACNIEEKRTEKNRTEQKKKEEKTEVPFVGKVLAVWNEWEVFRIEKKKKLTPSTIRKQIQFLGGRGDPEIIEILNRSITNGWVGLFELPNTNHNGNRNGVKTSVRSADAVISPGKDFGQF